MEMGKELGAEMRDERGERREERREMREERREMREERAERRDEMRQGTTRSNLVSLCQLVQSTTQRRQSSVFLPLATAEEQPNADGARGFGDGATAPTGQRRLRLKTRRERIHSQRTRNDTGKMSGCHRVPQ